MTKINQSLFAPLLAIGALLLCACQGVASEEQSVRVSEAKFVSLGGLEQWITIRGESANKPVLLLIHGGPADAQSSFVENYAAYEKEFILVQWDQRGAGKTFARHGAGTQDLTLKRVAEDGVELAEQLKARFPDNNLIVLGHSWGSVIALKMLQTRPELFSAYVGTGQVSSWEESVNIQFDFLLAAALKRGDQRTAKELQAIGRPDPLNIPQYFFFSRGLREQMHPADKAWLAGLKQRFLDSPGNTHHDYEIAGKGMDFSGQRLIQTIVRTDLRRPEPRIGIPFYVIQGQHDLNTPTAAAQKFFGQVAARDKKMIVIPDAGHFALATHAQQFAEILAGLKYKAR